MHVGNLRTALYEYLIAKSLNGKFVLRIEDTDQERLVEGAVDVIYDTLKQVGIVHDEGPDVGGTIRTVRTKSKERYVFTLCTGTCEKWKSILLFLQQRTFGQSQ